MSVPVYDGAVKKLQFQSGADADKLDSYGVVGEPLWTTDTKKLWVHDGTSYVLVDVPQDADEVPFDNTSNGMTATDVQAAIEEVDTRTGKTAFSMDEVTGVAIVDGRLEVGDHTLTPGTLSQSSFRYGGQDYAGGPGLGVSSAFTFTSSGNGIYPSLDLADADGVTNIDCALYDVTATYGPDGHITIYYASGFAADLHAAAEAAVGVGNAILDAVATDVFVATGGAYVYGGDPAGWTVVSGDTDPPTLNAVLTPGIKRNTNIFGTLTTERFDPPRESAASEPTLASGEQRIWRDSGSGQVWMVYNDPDAGQVKVELT